MYKYIDVDSNLLPTSQTRELDRSVKQFYKRVVPEFHDALSDYVGNFFIRQPEAPLKQFLISHYKTDNEYEDVAAWGKASAVFSDYGYYLIARNPGTFFREYMLLNAKNYFLPPLEKLDLYNLGMDSVFPIAQYWFHFKSPKIHCISNGLQGTLLFAFPPLFLLINSYILWSLATYWIHKKNKNTDAALTRAIALVGTFWIANFCFCVFATILVFRYQVFPMLLYFSFSLLFLELPDKQLAKNVAATIREESKKVLNAAS